MSAVNAEPELGRLLASISAGDVTDRELAGLEDLVQRTTGQLHELLAHILLALREGQDLVLFEAKPQRGGEWDGFPSQRDLVAAMLYNARAQSPREMTPERWAGICRKFPGSARQCLEQADDELADM